MRDVLEVCARNFEKARSGIFAPKAHQFQVRRPAFCLKKPEDKLNLLFDNLDLLWSQGVVVWGAVAQANSLLFDKTKPQSCPADVVYSLDEPASVNMHYLAEAARAIFEVKNTEPEDPQEAEFAQCMTNEYLRSYGLDVPPKFSPWFPSKISVTFFERSEIPGRSIVSTVLPIVACPKEPFLVLPLPLKLWERGLRQRWIEAAQG
jgi:hypothetical protein